MHYDFLIFSHFLKMAMSNNERVPKLDVKDKKIEKKEIEEKGKKKKKKQIPLKSLGACDFHGVKPFL